LKLHNVNEMFCMGSSELFFSIIVFFLLMYVFYHGVLMLLPFFWLDMGITGKKVHKNYNKRICISLFLCAHSVVVNLSQVSSISLFR
jgi:hypothetical protein